MLEETRVTQECWFRENRGWSEGREPALRPSLLAVCAWWAVPCPSLLYVAARLWLPHYI